MEPGRYAEGCSSAEATGGGGKDRDVGGALDGPTTDGIAVGAAFMLIGCW
jgi:hypothetical protein